MFFAAAVVVAAAALNEVSTGGGGGGGDRRPSPAAVSVYRRCLPSLHESSSGVRTAVPLSSNRRSSVPAAVIMSWLRDGAPSGNQRRSCGKSFSWDERGAWQDGSTIPQTPTCRYDHRIVSYWPTRSCPYISCYFHTERDTTTATTSEPNTLTYDGH